MHSQDYVPEVYRVADVYPAPSHAFQALRWEQVSATFRQIYGAPADFISRSPGRVNLIGEHIDYMLFSVLPMAVEVDVLLAVRVVPQSSKIKLANMHGDQFPPREFEIHEDNVEIDASKHEWSNYFKSGYRGAAEFLRGSGFRAANKPVGMEVLVAGNVPTGGGLSSSAAFVCASALAVLRAAGVQKVNKKELVNLAMVSERYVGVNSGGMDQSTSVLGLEGSALFISFHPTLSATPVAFPRTITEPVFLIANTLKVVDKHVTGPIHYNLRVVETTLAAEVLARKLSLGPLPTDAGPLGTTLKGLLDLYIGRYGKSDLESLAEMEAAARMHLYQYGYTRDAIAASLDITTEELESRYMTKFPIRGELFQLRMRALHVFREASRVVQYYTILVQNAGRLANHDMLVNLGELMNASQSDCRALFECSCDELDELCKIACAAGAYGSRLTGAGWGGCSVHLVPHDKVTAVKEAWLREYYGKRFPNLHDDQLEDAIVVSKPGSGAVVMPTHSKNFVVE